ncbi:50S ribosomal protein L15 [Candidatus Vidania fulgoroideorum]
MKKRLGRGNSSKVGNTCKRGYKGQKSRSGYSKKEFFLGGQTPYNILFPKYGFKKVKNNFYISHFGFVLNYFENKLNIKFKILNRLNLKTKVFFLNFNSSKKFKKKLEFLGGYINE